MVENWKNVTLNYFPTNGLACIARMLLHHGKVKYTNNFITKEQWPENASKFEMGFLPVLEIDGKQYSQSYAIWFYLSKNFQLMGSDNEEEYSVISTVLCMEDIKKPLMNLLSLAPGSDVEAALKEAQAEFSHFAKIWEKRYVSNGSNKTFLASGLSLVDFFFAYIAKNYVDGFLKEQFSETFTSSAPVLYKYVSELLESEPFKSFFESDQYFKGVM